MDLDDVIVATYCLIDEMLAAFSGGRRRRQRGPEPIMADAEVLTMEIVGEYLGLDQDTTIYAYFRRHYAAWFPALARMHRTTFTRQAANLWAVKEQLWRVLATRLPHDPHIALIDSFPLPVCRFARAHRCRLFRGEAAFGHDEGARQTFFGFRAHVRLAWPGVIAGLVLAPADISEPEVALALAEGTSGYLVGDRNYWSPLLAEAVAADGVCLLAPYRKATQDPDPARSRYLSRLRYRIETVFGQLVDRYQAKRVRARDLWHLCGRLMRKVLSHTVVLLLNHQLGNPPRQLARLLA